MIKAELVKAVFIERDGLLNEARSGASNQEPPLSFEEFKLIKSAKPSLLKLKKAGFVLIVTTNQPGLSKGKLSRRDLERMNNVIREYFPVDDILFCPHSESGKCFCRKPRVGMITEAKFKYTLTLSHSFVISNKWHDAIVAQETNCTSIQIKSPWNGKVHHSHLVATFDEAVKKVLTLDRKTI